MDMVRFYNNKGSEDTLLPYIGRGYAHYANGDYGEIYVDTDYRIWFKPMILIDGVTYESKEPQHYLGRGFIAYYIINDAQDTRTMLHSYFDMCINKYIEIHRTDASAWKKATIDNWCAEYLPIHVAEEKAYKEECTALFAYLSKKDKSKITTFYDSYREWLHLNPLYHADRYTILNVLNLGTEWTDERKDVLLKAISREYIKIEGTHLNWVLSKSLLDYFVGKLFCNDYIKESKSYREPNEWERKGTLFELKRLQELFDYNALGDSRNRKPLVVPRNYKLIDQLFQG